MNETHQVLDTHDGSRTLFSHQFQQSFHSIHGALTECKYVFLDGCKLDDRFSLQTTVSILEIGFGAGLNWLLTTSLALQYPMQLFYTGLDMEIPPAHVLSELSYQKHIDPPHLAETLIKWRKHFPTSVPRGSYYLSLPDKSMLELHIDDILHIHLPSLHYNCIVSIRKSRTYR